MASSSTTLVGRAVAGAVIGLIRDLLHYFRAHILELVLEGYLLGDGDPVVRNARAAIALLEHDIAAARAQGSFHRARGLLDTGMDGLAGLFAEQYLLCHKKGK